MDLTFDLETKPLTRALITFGVKSVYPVATQDASPGPLTHLELLQAGVTTTASVIMDTALQLLGRSSLSASRPLPGDAPVIIGFGLLMMLGIAQAVGKEGITLDTDTLTERLIDQQLAQSTRTAGDDAAAQRDVLEVSRTAIQIPGQIVATAKGEVEDLFRTCYSLLPEYIQGTEETRRQLMPIFGTALLLLLESQIKTDD